MQEGSGNQRPAEHSTLNCTHSHNTSSALSSSFIFGSSRQQQCVLPKCTLSGIQGSALQHCAHPRLCACCGAPCRIQRRTRRRAVLPLSPTNWICRPEGACTHAGPLTARERGTGSQQGFHACQAWHRAAGRQAAAGATGRQMLCPPLSAPAFISCKPTPSHTPHNPTHV